ncbi:hypothetical protein NEMBOFW57_006533 [Staphylotrichum longicolle]|uniref:Uncharacterized protein n=1 Tax=Staphylotrichum longicolle TaxID=669026 RepID=A0AAD4EX93_9PEZI|nr:hypothetical protein NEMBOFW57_006533 [Staphylotrichum longicolle]
MSSSTPNDAALQSLTTHIVLEWDATSPNGDERHFLTAPDPSDAKIVFKSDISTISNHGATGSAVGVFMRLHIPVKLRNVPARTPIHIHIRPSRVQSCTFAIAADAPEAVRAGSRCQLASLSMKLSGPVQVVVPHTMAASSRPAKNRASGRVLDAIRSLSRATQLVMYMPANLAPRTHMQRLSALLTGGALQELPPYTELFKLFGGSGGRIWDVEPLQHLPEKAQTPEVSVLQRLALLEALVHAQAVQISNLSSENQAQRKRIDEYETDLAALRLEIGRVDRQVDRVDLDVSEQREDIMRLEGSVQYCLDREDELVEAVVDTVTEKISVRGLSAANIHFTLGEG